MTVTATTPITTAPDVLAEIGEVLDGLSLAEQDQIDVELDFLNWKRQDDARGFPGALLEIVEGSYVAGDLLRYALAVMPYGEA